MKNLFTILAFVASILAILLAVLPLSNLAVFPAIAALLFGIAAYYLSKKTGNIKKTIQFSFLLTLIALVLTTYKAIFNEAVVESTDNLEATEDKLEEEAIEELEALEIDDVEFDNIEIEESELENITVDE